MRTLTHVLAASLLVMVTSVLCAAQTPSTPKMDMKKLDIMLMKPTAVKTGANDFEVMVKDPAGKPLTKADVSITFVMPKTATMAEMRNTVKLKDMGNGMYGGAGNVMMSGKWNATVDVMQNGKMVGDKTIAVDAK